MNSKKRSLGHWREERGKNAERSREGAEKSGRGCSLPKGGQYVLFKGKAEGGPMGSRCAGGQTCPGEDQNMVGSDEMVRGQQGI